VVHSAAIAFGTPSGVLPCVPLVAETILPSISAPPAYTSQFEVIWPVTCVSMPSTRRSPPRTVVLVVESLMR
jgi:hypothetical protein